MHRFPFPVSRFLFKSISGIKKCTYVSLSHGMPELRKRMVLNDKSHSPLLSPFSL
jgi:hypothetical protein